MANDHDAGRQDPADLFDAQQRSVLALAARDPLASITFDKQRTRGWRAFVFGKPVNYCLANDRLEVLRVTAVLLRQRGFPAEQFYRFRLAGYSRDQFDAIAAMFAPASDAEVTSSVFDLPAYSQAAGPADTGALERRIAPENLDIIYESATAIR